MTYPSSIQRTVLSAALMAALFLLPPPASSEPDDQAGLARIRHGEGALTFSAGFIRQSLPMEGVVNPITGDAQTTGNKQLLGAGDLTYLRLTKASNVAPGDLLTLYKRIHEVFHPTQGHYLGNLFSMVGVAKVLAVDDRLATVRILLSYGPINSGDGAMSFAPPAPEEPARADRVARPITGLIVDLPPRQSLIGQSDVVYIDRGRKDGLTPGDRMDIFRLGGGLPMRLIGEVKILALEETTATALIVRSTAPVFRGDHLMLNQPPSHTTAATPAPLADESDRLTAAATGRPRPSQAAAVADGLEAQLTALARQLEFEPGEAPVKPSGRPILQRIAALLKPVRDKRIIVAGHADDRPIGPVLQRQLPSNQALSEARAASVARYLAEEGGVDEASLYTIGYADRRPIASNSTEEGRRKNRRIEIALQPQPATPKRPPLPPDLTLPSTVPPAPAEAAPALERTPDETPPVAPPHEHVPPAAP